MTSPSSRRAHVVGLGLIGSSVALALAESGWSVSGTDLDDRVVEAARTAGVIVRHGARRGRGSSWWSPRPRASWRAWPLTSSARVTKSTVIVTDVAGVKSAIVAEVSDPRFLAGHPMAGSELRGLAGARADLFRGCTWVLTPTSATRPETYTALHGFLRELGANVVAVEPTITIVSWPSRATFLTSWREHS